MPPRFLRPHKLNTESQDHTPRVPASLAIQQPITRSNLHPTRTPSVLAITPCGPGSVSPSSVHRSFWHFHQVYKTIPIFCLTSLFVKSSIRIVFTLHRLHPVTTSEPYTKLSLHSNGNVRLLTLLLYLNNQKACIDSDRIVLSAVLCVIVPVVCSNSVFFHRYW